MAELPFKISLLGATFMFSLVSVVNKR